MKNFAQKAKTITETVMLVSGFVMAIAAAFTAFSTEMQKHYSSPSKANDEISNS